MARASIRGDFPDPVRTPDASNLRASSSIHDFFSLPYARTTVTVLSGVVFVEPELAGAFSVPAALPAELCEAGSSVGCPRRGSDGHASKLKSANVLHTSRWI